MPGIAFLQDKRGSDCPGLGATFSQVRGCAYLHEGPRMAKRCAALMVIAVGLVALTGCQPQQPASLVKNLPPPNFDGPNDLTAPLPPPIAPPRPTPPIATIPKAPTNKGPFANVPADWIPPIRANAWRWIVIHHSATSNGGAVMFDRIHKAKNWDELGYHFVIGNGTDTKDGEIEVGPRWRKQKWGAHAKTPDNRYNDYGIGICLVGNFDLTRPSQKQLQSLAKLVAYLEKTYNISSDRVIGHGTVHSIDKGGTATDCPGKLMNVAQVRQLSGKILADAGMIVPESHTATAVGGDLLYDSAAQGH